jgi:hypothetical protein
MSSESIIPPNPQVVPPATQKSESKDPMFDPVIMKRLAEMGAMMVCAPVAFTLRGEDGRTREVQDSLLNIIIQIAQGAPLASSVHPVRRQIEGKDVIQHTSVLQLLAEQTDILNDIACMTQEMLDGESEGGDDDDDDEPENNNPRRRGYRGG